MVPAWLCLLAGASRREINGHPGAALFGVTTMTLRNTIDARNGLQERLTRLSAEYDRISSGVLTRQKQKRISTLLKEMDRLEQGIRRLDDVAIRQAAENFLAAGG